MYRGEFVAVLDGRSTGWEEVGLLMATGRREPTEAAGATEAAPSATEAAPPTADHTEPERGPTPSDEGDR
jgi:hypothetical protein